MRLRSQGLSAQTGNEGTAADLAPVRGRGFAAKGGIWYPNDNISESAHSEISTLVPF